MTRSMQWVGLIALVVLTLVIAIYNFNEPAQQATILHEIHYEAVLTATGLYAQNCVVCHGAGGEGIGTNPPLNTEGIRTMSEEDLYRVIASGRYNTLMAAWSVEEGGVFTSAQVKDLVTFVLNANWEYVDFQVAELGLTPPEMVHYEISDEMIGLVGALPGGEALSQSLVLYAEICAACHGANGAGTLIAPPLDSEDLRTETQEDLQALISDGVTGTLMSGWQGALTPEEITGLISLIYRWPEILDAGIEFPEAVMSNFPATPEMIADGGHLFTIACKSCHGVNGYGSPMAPALNNQIFLSQTPDAAIYQIIAGGVSGTLMPAWGARLTDYDLQALVAYLRSLETSAPPIVPPILSP